MVMRFILTYVQQPLRLLDNDAIFPLFPRH